MVAKRHRLCADAEVCPRDPPATDHVLRQPGDRGSADRTLKMPGHAGRRDADDMAEHIDERSPREAGIEREIDREQLAGPRLAARANVECADDAGAGPRARAESQDQVADAEITIVADVGG